MIKRIFILCILITLCAGCGSSDSNHSKATDYCKRIVITYLDWYMKENIPVDISERKKIKNEIHSFATTLSESAEIDLDRMFEDSMLDTVIYARHKAIMGRLGNDNTIKKEKLFEMQDKMYKNLKYEISSKEDENGVMIKVKFYPVDKEKAQAMYDKHFAAEAKKIYSTLYTDGMDCIQLKARIDEQEANDMNKIKEIVDKASSGALDKEEVPENVYAISLELQKMMNEYGLLTDQFLAIQEDSVLAAYEKMGYSSNSEEFIFYFNKIKNKGETLIRLSNNNEEPWKILDRLFWGVDSSSESLLPVKVDSSYFRTGW